MPIVVEAHDRTIWHWEAVVNPVSLRVKRTACIASGAVLLAGATTGFVLHEAGKDTVTDQDGTSVEFANPDHVGKTDSGVKYAPRPASEFHNQKCDLSPQGDTDSATGRVSISGTDITAPLQQTNSLASLPDAPNVAWYQGSAPIGSSAGKSVVAGHVDFAPGAKSATGGELSPFGHLHEIDPCQHITATDADGDPHEYAATSMYTVKQEDIESSGIYTTDGDPKLELITCSGKSIDDAGGANQFNYQYNLVVEATPVEAGA